MKLLLNITLCTLLLSSCRKDRGCSCTVSSNAPGSQQAQQHTTYKEAYKRDVRKKCINRVESSSAYTYTYTCSLD